MIIIGREVVESVVEELRRHGILVQDNPDRRLTSIDTQRVASIR